VPPCAVEQGSRAARGEKSVVANLDEAGGQDVQEKATDEFMRAERSALAVLGGATRGRRGGVLGE